MRATRYTLATVAVLLAITGGTARGQGIVDQETTCNDGGAAQILLYEPIAQRFRPAAPNLTAVEVLLGRFNAPYTDTLTMRILRDSVGGAFVAGASELVAVGPSYTWVRFDLPAPVVVTPGAPYVIALDATNAALGWAHQYEAPPRCSYPNGEEIISGMRVPGLDASFRTYTLCGNGTLDPGELCDDGNADARDGCTNACTPCGDGIVQTGEECDDGNLVDGDGCDADCTLTACGNGIVSPGEECDDGNRVSGDCCSSTCKLEPAGTTCTEDLNVCTFDFCNRFGQCIHPPNTAPCNDGNLCNGADTCSAGVCSVHAGNPCGSEPVCERACIQTSTLQYHCGFDASGTACPADANACTSDVCNGAGTCTHPVAADGTSCEDGDRCSTGDSCRAGACQSGPPVTCDPCLTCDAATGSCVVPTSPGCAAAVTDRASIALRDSPSDLTDKVLWKWRGRNPVAKADFGSPATTTAMTLCIFDQGGLKLSATAPSGGTCAGKSCWRELPLGYRYADRDGTPDGLLKIFARAGGAAQAKLAVKGRGPLLAMPSLGLTPPVTVRLERNDTGACWESVHSVPIVSDVLQFKSRSD
jgi:cysteine-rich repeat protein